MNKTFIGDYTYLNDTWKVFQLDEADALEYYNISNKNNIKEIELNLPNSQLPVTQYITSTNKLLYSMMDDNKIEFLNVVDYKFYNVYNVLFNYLDNAIILYYCNENDPFIVVPVPEVMEINFIFYLNKKEIILLDPYAKDKSYRYFNDIINTITWGYNNQNLISPVNYYKKYLFFGFNMNVGHYLWNEVSGLYYFLENKNYHDKIDGIIIGPYDAFNIECFLKEKYNFNILKFSDLFGECRHWHFKNLTNIFPIFLNSFYIDKNVKNIINQTYNIITKDNINSEIINNNILEITIEIRTHRRFLINQDIFYVELIKKLLEDYKQYIIKINITGFFQTNSITLENGIIDFDKNKGFTDQNEIANKIIQNFNGYGNIIFKNLIGNSFYNILEDVIRSKIFIGVIGTSSINLLNMIYNVKLIYFGPKEAYCFQHNQIDVLNNYDGIYCPIEITTTNNGRQEPFEINFDLYYDFFKNELNKLL